MTLGATMLTIGAFSLLVVGFMYLDAWTDVMWNSNESDEYYAGRKAFMKKAEFMLAVALILCFLGAYRCG